MLWSACRGANDRQELQINIHHKKCLPVLDAEEAACRRRTPPFPLGSAAESPPWPQPSSGTRLCVEGGLSRMEKVAQD